jgi:hypothetical protein
MLKKLAGEVITEIIRYSFFAALAFLVVITSLLAKPKKSILGTEFPPPLGARLIAWGSVGAWLVLGLAAFAVGWLLVVDPVRARAALHAVAVAREHFDR